MPRRPGALRFAVSRSNGGPTLLDGARRFAVALDERLGVGVEVVIRYDNTALLKAILGGGAELAWMSPLLQARALDGGARLIALSQRGGALGYKSAIVVHVDSRYRALTDLVNVRAAWVDRESASGYVVPRQHLAGRGLDLARAFRTERFFGSAAAACRAVVDGEADVGACFVRDAGDVASATAEVQRTAPALRALDVTARIPPDGLVVAAGLDPAEQSKLREALLDLHARPEGRDALTMLMQADRLAPVGDEALKAVRRLTAA